MNSEQKVLTEQNGEFKEKSTQKDHLDYLMENLAELQNFKRFEYTTICKFEKGDNYLGDIRRVKVKGVTQCNEEQILNLIVKSSPMDSAVRKEIRLDTIYNREFYVYSVMLKTLREFQNQFSIPEKEKFKYAKCYTALCEENEQSLVFDDLNNKGYKMYDRLKSLDYDHLMLIVTTLAKFHALSFAAKHKIPKEFEDFKKHVASKNDMGNSFNNYFDDVKITISKFLDDIEKEKFLKYCDCNMLEKYFSYLNMLDSKEDPYTTITHGDTWINNMLFHYENDKVSDIILVDWQIIKYCSPVTDLVYLLFCCTDEEIRLKSFEDIFSTYYNTLSSRLVDFGCDPDTVYPEHVFRSHLKEYQGYGLLMSMCLVPLMLNKREDSINLSDLLDENGFKHSIVKFSEDGISRLRGIIRHFVNLGVI